MLKFFVELAGVEPASKYEFHKSSTYLAGIFRQETRDTANLNSLLVD